MLIKAMMMSVSSDRLLRSFTTSFIQPLLCQTPFAVEVEVLREGKTLSFVQARAVQQGKTALMTQACFGLNQPASIQVQPANEMNLRPPELGKKIPYLPKVTPSFIQFVEVCITVGAQPFSGTDLTELGGWMRFREPTAQMDESVLVALIDVWPPTVLPMLKQPSMASTVTWNVELLHPLPKLQPEQFLGYLSRTRASAHGFSSTEANIWNRTGELIAISRQNVAVYET